MTNIYAREEWRKSVISPACIGVVSGFGKHSYLMAIYFLNEYLKK